MRVGLCCTFSHTSKCRSDACCEKLREQCGHLTICCRVASRARSARLVRPGVLRAAPGDGPGPAVADIRPRPTATLWLAATPPPAPPAPPAPPPMRRLTSSNEVVVPECAGAGAGRALPFRRACARGGGCRTAGVRSHAGDGRRCLATAGEDDELRRLGRGCSWLAHAAGCPAWRPAERRELADEARDAPARDAVERDLVEDADDRRVCRPGGVPRRDVDDERRRGGDGVAGVRGEPDASPPLSPPPVAASASAAAAAARSR